MVADSYQGLPLVCLDKLIPVMDRSANAQGAPDTGWPGQSLFTCSIHDLSQILWGENIYPFIKF